MTRQLEKRLVNDYLKEFYFDKHFQCRAWIGPVPPGEDEKLYQVTTRWADTIIFEPNLITIIEFKMEPQPTAIGQLDLYAQLFGKTLRFQQYWGIPVKRVLVTTRVDVHVQELCDQHDIEVRVFHPDWVTYWEKRRFKL